MMMHLVMMLQRSEQVDDNSNNGVDCKTMERLVAHSFVTQQDCDNIPKLVKRRKLLGAAIAWGVETNKGVRESNPINEFLDNEDLLTGAFPDVFMFGNLTGTHGKK